jgi:hypothetical protein
MAARRLEVVQAQAAPPTAPPGRPSRAGCGRPVLQHIVRPGDQVSDGPGDQGLAGAGGRQHPGGDVHRDAAHVGAADLHLPGVQADADVHAIPRSRSRRVVAQRIAWSGRSKAARMPSPVDLTRRPWKRSTSWWASRSWASSSAPPAAVADRPRPLGRADDVGEQHGGPVPARRPGGRAPRSRRRPRPAGRRGRCPSRALACRPPMALLWSEPWASRAACRALTPAPRLLLR